MVQEYVEHLAPPPDELQLHEYSDQLTSLDLRGQAIEEIGALPLSLRELDLRHAAVTVLTYLPPELHALDVRYTPIANLPYHLLPPNLNFLGVDARLLDGWDRLPGTITSLAINNISRPDFLKKLPPKLERLQLESAQLQEISNLPNSLQELALIKAEIDKLENLPLRLRRLTLVASPALQLDHIPPYLTHLSLVSNDIIVEASFSGDPRFRFLHTLSSVKSRLLLSSSRSLPPLARIFPLLKRVDTDMPLGKPTPPWLSRLRIEANGAILPVILDGLIKAPQLSEMRINITTDNLNAVMERPEIWDALTEITLKDSYLGQMFPPNLEGLDLELRDVAVESLPESLERLTVRHHGDKRIEDLIDVQAIGSTKLQCLSLTRPTSENSHSLALKLPPTLKTLVIKNFNIKLWARGLDDVGEIIVPPLEDVTFINSQIDFLRWLPQTVNRLVLSEPPKAEYHEDSPCS